MFYEPKKGYPFDVNPFAALVFPRPIGWVSSLSIKGIANLGYRPTFKQKKLLLEVDIFNFSGNLYNKHLIIEFISFIRKEKKFKNINQLRNQINLDFKIAKKKLN